MSENFKTKIIDNVNVASNIEISDEEAQAYINRGREKQKHMKLTDIEVRIDGDDADISYVYDKTPFERIRRITGYLVGTLDRFNNAKRAEVMDRVKHEVTDDCEDVYIDNKETETNNA